MVINKNVENDKEWKRIISAGLVVYRMTSEGPKFLLLYRGRGAWDMPRGRMETRERSLETAFREVEEETGLRRSDLDVKRNFKMHEKFPYSRTGAGKIFKIVIFYLAETKKKQIELSREHEGYGWFSLYEANKYLGRYRVRKSILRKAWEHIRRF
ncbi:MAG: NUDIX domain-containing protein [Patescibacteria group bacterium]